MTSCLPESICIDPLNPDPAVIADAARRLAEGELIVVPTETVYGLAADPRAAGAVERIYEVKGRPANKEIPLLAADVDSVLKRVSPGVPSELARRLADRFWPGALTMVLPTSEGPVGFRVPDFAATLDLLRAAGGVLAVTSANRSGEPPARTARAAADALGGEVGLILDAGHSPGGAPSTVVRLDPDGCSILREGAIPAGAIERVIAGR